MIGKKEITSLGWQVVTEYNGEHHSEGCYELDRFVLLQSSDDPTWITIVPPKHKFSHHLINTIEDLRKVMKILNLIGDD